MNGAEVQSDAFGAYLAAKVWLGGHSPLKAPDEELLSRAERDAIEAFRYYEARRNGHEPDSIPIAFGRVVLSSAEHARWWNDEVPEPIPFNPTGKKGEGLEEKRKVGEFELLDEEQIQFTVALSVLRVRDRLKKAS